MPVYPYKTDKKIRKLSEVATINECHDLLGPQAGKIWIQKESFLL